MNKIKDLRIYVTDIIIMFRNVMAGFTGVALDVLSCLHKDSCVPTFLL